MLRIPLKETKVLSVPTQYKVTLFPVQAFTALSAIEMSVRFKCATGQIISFIEKNGEAAIRVTFCLTHRRWESVICSYLLHGCNVI